MLQFTIFGDTLAMSHNLQLQQLFESVLGKCDVEAPHCERDSHHVRKRAICLALALKRPASHCDTGSVSDVSCHSGATKR